MKITKLTARALLCAGVSIAITATAAQPASSAGVLQAERSGAPVNVISGMVLAVAEPGRTLQSIPGVIVKYYDVNGKTVAEVRESIASQRPKSAKGDPIPAGTSWDLNATVTKRTEGDVCTTTAAKVTLKGVVELPRLVEPKEVKPEFLQVWNKYVANLESAAAADLGLVADSLPQVEKALVGTSCDQANTAMNAAAARLKEQQRALGDARAVISQKLAAAQAGPAIPPVASGRYSSTTGSPASELWWAKGHLYPGLKQELTIKKKERRGLVLLSCSPARMGASTESFWLSKDVIVASGTGRNIRVTAKLDKSSGVYLDPLGDEGVGSPYTLIMSDSETINEAEIPHHLRPNCVDAAPAVTADEIKRRFGYWSGLLGQTVRMDEAPELAHDYRWFRPGEVIVRSTRMLGSPEVGEHVYISYDAASQTLVLSGKKIQPSYGQVPPVMPAGFVLLTAGEEAAIAARATAQAQAGSSSGGGGFLKVMQGAIAGATGIANAGGGLSEALTGAAIGAVAGGAGVDTGSIATAMTTATVEERQRINDLDQRGKRAIADAVANASSSGSTGSSGSTAASKSSGTENSAGSAPAGGESKALFTRTVPVYFFVGMQTTEQNTRNPTCYSNIFSVTVSFDQDPPNNIGPLLEVLEPMMSSFVAKCSRLGRVLTSSPPNYGAGDPIRSIWPRPTPHAEDYVVDM